MRVSLICAASKNGVIGTKNELPWKLPADLKRFKELTLNHPVIMGRKTHQSIGRALPGRSNIVVTRQKGFIAEGCRVVHSIEDAIKACEGADEVFVIGGAQIYEKALPHANRIYLTRIHHEFEGDAFVFEIDEAVWKQTTREDFEADQKNPYAYSFVALEKANPSLG